MKSKLIHLKTIVALAILFSSPAYGQKSEPSARHILEKAADLVDYQSISMKIVLKTSTPSGSVRVREIDSYSLSGNDVSKMLIRITAPPDQRGVAMLIHDYRNKSDDMWIYLPALRKSRRIVSSEKGSQFMGSEFLNSDMSRPVLKDFSHSVKGTSKIDNQECWIIESVALDANVARENGCNKKISYVTKKDTLCRKTEFYDSGSNLQRVQTISKFVKNGTNSYIATLLDVLNKKTGRRSTIEISPVTENAPLDGISFDPSMLH